LIDPWTTAVETAALVGAGAVTAREVAEAALAGIAAGNPRLNAFTTVTADRALEEAAAIDAARARGEPLPPLAGAPYAVKNLFDLAGVVTTAGSRIEREKRPAAGDAFLVRRLHAAGALCLGALNMDEYAYGFTTENAHDGPCRNPHDLARSAGGSSGGSGAAVAGGLVPLSLGSDTNGSIRVPASLCGIFGLKPTYGRLSRGGTFPFVASLDHLGPFARTVADLAAAFDALQGRDPADPAQGPWSVEPVTPLLGQGADGIRTAVADDHFARNGHAEAFEAVAAVASALGTTRRVTIPEAERGRAAAFVITAAEGANLHLQDLVARAQDFDPATRDRFLAGSLIPATWVVQAQRFRAWYRARVAELLREVDVILAPATPYPAPALGQETIEVDGEVLPVRPMLGVFTQPISCIGLPVLAVPVPPPRPGGLPIGVQLIGAPGREDLLFRVADLLECQGVVRAPRPPAVA
jgi:AtzE family amidohydrolase